MNTSGKKGFSVGKEQELTEELFQNPGSSYRGAPFWGWNGALKKEELEDQIEKFRQMGFGGFHMHARAGLATDYLSDTFMDRVRDCCRKADEEGLLAWLYDEDRYPSGPAGGKVTADPAFTRRYLRVTPYAAGDPRAAQSLRGYERAARSILLTRYELEWNEQDQLLGFRRLSADADPLAQDPHGNEPAAARREIWYAYFECTPASRGMEQSYVDPMNPEAIRSFIDITHERYKECVGEYFGSVSPAMFTDEPQVPAQIPLSFARDRKDMILPWTDDLERSYRERFGEELLDAVPEVIWDLPDGKASLRRWQYHEQVTEVFVSAFCDQLGEWCGRNGLAFSGHVMGEGSLANQTRSVGEAMRCYRSFQLPGMDVLGRHVLEYMTAKQTQSAVRQQDSMAMLSELYGVSGWDFDFRNYKLQGDWQAALGVTLRVPHHSWYTMYGEGKRDYPGSISYQAPWWKQYHWVEDHFARVNTAMTRGQAEVEVAVLHPIESAWLEYGPGDQSGAALAELDRRFLDLTHLLLENLIDFDYISESRLPELCPEGGFPLQVGAMRYRTVIIPEAVTLRSTSLQRLEQFQKAGGKVIFLGEMPQLIDARPSLAAEELFKGALHAAGGGASLIRLLEDQRKLDVRLPNGDRASHLIYQLRREDGQKWLFLATTRSQPSPDADIPVQSIKFNVGQRYDTEVLQFELNGEYQLTEYDTLTGAIRPLKAQYRQGKTCFVRRWYMHDSLLLRLVPGRNEGHEPAAAVDEGAMRIRGKVPVTLEEPNVLLLDRAAFSLDGGPLEPEEEILRLENICRRRIGTMERKRAIPQPYQMPQETPVHQVRLVYTIESEIETEELMLALEDESQASICLNGEPVSSEPVGWYVDHAIHTLVLPGLKKGTNQLEIERPLGLRTVMESVYLLGDFGVSVQGTELRVTAPVRELAFGSWTTQGLAFYGSNVTYHLDVETEGPAVLRCPHYRGALLSVSVDGKERGLIVTSPYRLELADLSAGKHRIDITVYGSRNNTFGPLHHLGSIPYAQGPDAYRSTHDLWNEEYSLHEEGLMSSPRLYSMH